MRNKKKLIGVGVITTTLLAAGVAFAAWNASGTGSGYAKATTAQVLTTSDVAATTTAQLFPGGTADVKIKISNPNPYPVRITSITGNGAITSDKGAACDASTGVTFTNQTGLTLDLAAGATGTLTVPSSVSMTNASDNSCQGAVFTVPVSITGVSNA